MVHKLSTQINKYTHRILQFFLPQLCEICGKEDFCAETTSVCKSCLKENLELYPNFNPDFCPKCKTFLSGELLCKYCESRNVFFNSAFFLLRSKDIEKNLMNYLKRKNWKHCSQYFSLGLGSILREIRIFQPSALIPVPSHASSWRERPYYATSSLLNRLSKKLEIPILPILEKTSQKHQSTQNRNERFFHAKDAFKIKKNARIIHKPSLVLIDDVFTTGSSSNEISRLLIEHGASSVIVVSTIRKTEGIEI